MKIKPYTLLGRYIFLLTWGKRTTYPPVVHAAELTMVRWYLQRGGRFVPLFRLLLRLNEWLHNRKD